MSCGGRRCEPVTFGSLVRHFPATNVSSVSKCFKVFQRRDSRIFTEMDLEETKKEEILLTVNEIETKLDELNLKQHEKDT